MLSLIIRIITQIKNDKRTLGMLIIAPLLVLTLIFFLLGNSNYKATIGTINIPPVFENSLSENANVIKLDESLDVDQYLKDGKADGVVVFNSRGVELKMLEANSKGAVITKDLTKALGSLNPTSLTIKTNYIYGSVDDSGFTSMGYIFLGILSFFFTFVVSGMALVRERSGQTLERMLMTRVKRFEVIGGYTLGYGFFAAIQSIVLLAYGIGALGIASKGFVLLAMLVMILLAFTAVSMGALVSIFAKSEFQVAQFIPVILLPQVFFSGLIPLDTIPYNLGNLCYLMPIYYGCTALKKIMIQGAGISEVVPYILGLIAYLGVLFIINTIALKKYRKI